MPQDISYKSGFVAVVGRPNAGKSTLINAFVRDRVALVSHKAGATRKRQKAIVMVEGERESAQIVFVDTPGLDARQSALNLYMQKEARSAIEESDLVLFLADMSDGVQNYEKFLESAGAKKHIVALTKMDNFTHAERLAKLAEYQKFSDRFLELVPISAKKGDFEPLLKSIAAALPEHPYYYDPEDLTDLTVRELYKEMIREAIFDNYSDELPYSIEVSPIAFVESPKLDRISATIFVEKASQKAIVIGKDAQALKRVGRAARIAMEKFSRKKVFLELRVDLLEGWSKSEAAMKKLGYGGD